MSYLVSILPPFAADYSGVASALHDLGGLIVIHDASGCTGSYTGYDEPRWYHGKSSVYCSGLREVDAILGNDDRLLCNIEKLCRQRTFRFIAIIGSPVPMLVGFDFEGFSKLVEHETGIPTFGFSSTGFDCYHKGWAQACIAFADRFVSPCLQKTPSAVNILGASPLDNFNTDSIERLHAYVTAQGMSVRSVWGQGDGFEAMRRAGEARLNFVVSSGALPLARHFEKKWGIPFVAGVPAGDHLQGALARFDGGLPATLPATHRSAASKTHLGGSLLLLGEQLQMNALRHQLMRDSPAIDVTVASFFAWEAAIAEAQDRHLADESEAMTLIESGRFDAMLGDPLLRALVPSARPIAFVDLPHHAISGRIHGRYSNSVILGNAWNAFSDNIVSALSTQCQHINA